jgi:hypothetical protein
VRGIDERFRTPRRLFREFGFVFYLAVTQLEHGEWLDGGARSRGAAAAREARDTFERLQATPWLETTRRGGMRPAERLTPTGTITVWTSISCSSAQPARCRPAAARRRRCCCAAAATGC